MTSQRVTSTFHCRHNAMILHLLQVHDSGLRSKTQILWWGSWYTRLPHPLLVQEAPQVRAPRLINLGSFWGCRLNSQNWFALATPTSRGFLGFLGFCILRNHDHTSIYGKYRKISLPNLDLAWSGQASIAKWLDLSPPAKQNGNWKWPKGLGLFRALYNAVRSSLNLFVSFWFYL